MQIRTYPYTAWVINQMNKPKRVTFIGPIGLPGKYDPGDVASRRKKAYALKDIYPTREAALEAIASKG